MAWHADLSLRYELDRGRCVARFSHSGPLRILQTLHPEGAAIAHNVLVHPPGGLVGGDTLALRIAVDAGAHGLVTTPGATRFYRSDGAAATQDTRIAVAEGGRLEWLPLEAICHAGCIAENRVVLDLAAGAEAIGWDVMAFGLPASGQPFDTGVMQQHLEVSDAWLERGRIDAADALLMDGALGLAGQRCIGTLWFAAGAPIARARRDAALDAARAVLPASAQLETGEGTPLHAGATAPGPQVVVVRALAPLVEPVMQLMQAVRAAWRPLLWDLPPARPRTWSL